MLPWLLLATLSGLPLAPQTAEDMSPLSCVSDQAVGMSYDPANKTWKPTEFLAGTRYQIRPLVEKDFEQHPDDFETTPRPTWGFFASEDDEPYAGCTLDDAGFTCQGVDALVHIDRTSLRFSIAVANNYVDQGHALQRQKDSSRATSPNDDFIMIGTCSPQPVEPPDENWTEFK
jgi:hypothetical protein